MISTTEKPAKIKSIIRASSLIARMTPADKKFARSDVLYYKMLEKYFTNIYNVREQNEFLAAHTVFFPTEILRAMDIVSMHTEMTTWMMALFLGEQAELLSAGAELGLAPEICSPHRGLAGAFKIGSLPKPNVMLWSNLICDNTSKSGELVSEICDCPGFYLDHPFKNSPEEMNYLAEELGDLVQFLEQQSGRKMDYDKLGELIVGVNKQNQLFCEINELRKAVPCPFPPSGFLKLLSNEYLFIGQSDSIEYLETLKQELAEMIDGKIGFVSPERFRLMNLFVPPVYMMSFLDNIMLEFGAASVVDPFFNNYIRADLDTDKPLESIANRLYSIPARRTMYGPLGKDVIQELVDNAEQYKVDGAIYWAFIGCRQTCATIKLFKDVLADVDVPVLALDCDLVDPTINSEEELRGKMEQFFELLEDR